MLRMNEQTLKCFPVVSEITEEKKSGNMDKQNIISEGLGKAIKSTRTQKDTNKRRYHDASGIFVTVPPPIKTGNLTKCKNQVPNFFNCVAQVFVSLI